MNATNVKLTAEEVAQRVRRLAAGQGGVDPALVTAETRFTEDLNYDSLDRVEFVMTLEEAFDLTIPDAEAEQVRTVGEAVRLVAGDVC